MTGWTPMAEGGHYAPLESPRPRWPRDINASRVDLRQQQQHIQLLSFIDVWCTNQVQKNSRSTLRGASKRSTQEWVSDNTHLFINSKSQASLSNKGAWLCLSGGTLLLRPPTSDTPTPRILDWLLPCWWVLMYLAMFFNVFATRLNTQCIYVNTLYLQCIAHVGRTLPWKANRRVIYRMTLNSLSTSPIIT